LSCLGSGIRDPEKILSGSQILGVKKHRIPNPDPQHCNEGKEPQTTVPPQIAKIFAAKSKNIFKKKTHRTILLYFELYGAANEVRYGTGTGTETNSRITSFFKVPVQKFRYW
jgi:hypothetical protein